MGFLTNLFRLKSIVAENEELKKQIADNEKKYNESGFHSYSKIEDAIAGIEQQQSKKEANLLSLQADIDGLLQKQAKTEAQIKTNSRKLDKIAEIYRAAVYAIEKYTNLPYDQVLVKNHREIEESDLMPTVELRIHSMDVKDLNKAFKDNDKRIDEVTKKYRARYTTKANMTIYELMVIALRAELQNIL